MTPAEYRARRQLAQDLEDALKRAHEAGLSPGTSLSIMAQCLGYCLANGNPSAAAVREAVAQLSSCVSETAADVFMKQRGAAMTGHGEAGHA